MTLRVGKIYFPREGAGSPRRVLEIDRGPLQSVRYTNVRDGEQGECLLSLFVSWREDQDRMSEAHFLEWALGRGLEISIGVALDGRYAVRYGGFTYLFRLEGREAFLETLWALKVIFESEDADETLAQMREDFQRAEEGGSDETG